MLESGNDKLFLYNVEYSKYAVPKDFELNYRTLKNMFSSNMFNTLKCCNDSNCCIINLDKISEMYNIYSTNLYSTNNKIKNKNSVIQYDQDEILKSMINERFDKNYSINSNFDNMSQNTLNLFNCKMETTKKNSKLLQEELKEYDMKIGFEKNYYLDNFDGNTLLIKDNHFKLKDACKNKEVVNDFMRNINERLDKSENEITDTVSNDEDNSVTSRNLNYTKLDDSLTFTKASKDTNITKISNKINSSNVQKNTAKSESYLNSIDRPYHCDKCNMTFKRNLHLKRHFLVTHTMNKNFICEICKRSFSRKDYLDKHIRGHQKKNFKLKLLQQGIVIRTKIYSKSIKKKR